MLFSLPSYITYKKCGRMQPVISDHHIAAYMPLKPLSIKDGFGLFWSPLRSLVTADRSMLRKNDWIRSHLSTKIVIVVTFLPFLHRCLLFVAPIKLGVVPFRKIDSTSHIAVSTGGIRAMNFAHTIPLPCCQPIAVFSILKWEFHTHPFHASTAENQIPKGVRAQVCPIGGAVDVKYRDLHA